MKMLSFCHYVCNVVMDVISMLTTSGLSILIHDVVSLPDATSSDKNSLGQIKKEVCLG